MKTLKYLILPVLFALYGNIWSQTTIAAWEVGALPGGANAFGASPFAPQTSNANVTVVGLTRGAGIATSGTAAGGAWGGTNLIETSDVNAISNNDVVTTTITPNTGFQVSFSSFHYKRYRRSGTGPSNAKLQYRIGAGAYTDITTFSLSSSNAAGATLSAVDLTGIANLQNIAAGTNVVFRLVLWGGTNAGGTWYIYDQASTTDLDIIGTITPVAANSITTQLTPVGSPYSLANCLSTASGTVSYTQTGTFNAGNIFTAQLSDASGSFSSAVDIGTLSSQINGNINITIPAGTPSGTGYLIRVVGSNPATIGSSSSAFTINQGGLCGSVPTHYFRSTQDGNWNLPSTWESSPNLIDWIPATLAPTAASAGITIQNTHDVDINSIVNLDQTIIESGATLNYATGGNLTIANGTGDDLTIFGTFIHAGAALPSVLGTVRVKSGGVVRINVNTGSSSTTYGASSAFAYETGATFNWNVASSFSTSGTIYFPTASATDIATFLISANVTNAGAGAATTINGILKVDNGVSVSWSNAGTKTFRNGIQLNSGSTLTQNASSGALQINGTVSVFDGPGTLNLSTAGLNSTSLQITNGSNITVNTSAANATFSNIWIGNGNTISGTAEMIFNNANITGSTIFQRFGSSGNTSIQTGAGNLQQIVEYANLRSGILNTNSNLTLLSNAAGTAYLNDFSFPGNIVGNINVQRFNSIGVAGFRQLGTPVQLPSIAALSGFTPSGTPGFVIPVPTCSPLYVAANSPYGNWMQLVENGPVQFSCSQSLFQVLTSGGMTNGRGYYLDVPGNSTLTFTGAPNTGAVNFGLTHANTAVTNGWNMVSNPYPSPLAWEMANVPAGVDAIGKIWETYGTYAGTFRDLDPSASGTQAVAIGQAFQVRVTTPGASVPFSVDNTDRTTTPPTYSFAVNDPMTLNIDIIGGGFQDLTKVRFIDGASNGLDAMFDSPKMMGNANQPMVYSVWNGNNYSTNSYGELNDVYTLLLGVKVATSGQHTFTFSNIDQFPGSAFIYLEDTQLGGAWQDLRLNDTYSFTETAGVNESRFILHFFPPVEQTITDATCQTTGSVVLTEEAPATWNYVIADAQAQVVNQGSLNGAQTITNLPAGTYTLTLTEQTSGYVAVEELVITGVSQVSAQPQASSFSVIAGDEIQFTANTQNATAWAWSFGDGNTSVDQNPLHIYNASGNYDVTLTASNGDCDKVSVISVAVSVNTAGIVDEMAEVGVKMWNDDNIVYIEFKEQWVGETIFALYDASGKMVFNTQLNNATGLNNVDCGQLAAGTYTVELRNGDKFASRKTVMGIK